MSEGYVQTEIECEMNIVLSISTVYIQRPYVVTDLLVETGVNTVRTVQVGTDRTTSINSPLTHKIREKFRATIQYIRESNIKNYCVDEKKSTIPLLALDYFDKLFPRKFAVVPACFFRSDFDILTCQG